MMRRGVEFIAGKYLMITSSPKRRLGSANATQADIFEVGTWKRVWSSVSRGLRNVQLSPNAETIALARTDGAIELGTFRPQD